MSSILWLVYFAGVSENLSVIAGLGALIATIICIIIGAVHASEGEFGLVLPGIKKVVPWIVAAYLICIFTPSRSFLYMAAGMRAGGEIAQTELGQKAYRLLDKKLDELLGEGDKK